MQNRSAYTLIETAIVLIVISFLASAIVAGASLMENAKMIIFLDEFRTYLQAVDIFKQNTKKWPGDKNKSRKIGFLSGQLYDNNSFGGNYISSNYDYGIPSDSIGPFIDLFQKKYIEFEPRKNKPSISKLDWNNGGAPISKVFHQFQFNFQYNQNDDDFVGNKLAASYLKAKDQANSIPAKVAYNIDRKLDDGIYNKGLFRASCINSTDYKTAIDGKYGCFDVRYLME